VEALANLERAADPSLAKEARARASPERATGGITTEAITEAMGITTLAG
jgi:hypothetical protein